jgi:hypothetical protein
MVNYKVNEVVRVVGNVSGHGFLMGESIKLTYVPKTFGKGKVGLATAMSQSTGSRWSVNFKDVSKLSSSKESILSEIKEYEISIKNLRAKLEFIEEVGSEEFDEDEFKIYNALKALDKKGTRIEKARALKAIING